MNKIDQEFLVQKIRTQYTETQHTGLDELKALDSKVKGPARVFAYVHGTVGALIMGAGMSLIMTHIGEKIGLSVMMAPGIGTGVAGMILTLITHPIYQKILNRRKKKYAPEIMALSEKLLKG